MHMKTYFILFIACRIAAEKQEKRDYELAMRLAQVSTKTYVCTYYVRSTHSICSFNVTYSTWSYYKHESLRTYVFVLACFSHSG